MSARQHRDAAVMTAHSPGADHAARIVPPRAEVVTLGARGSVIAGYRMTPAGCGRRSVCANSVSARSSG